MLEKKLQDAIQIAKQAGQIAHNYFQKCDQLTFKTKANLQDVATEADIEVEKFIIEQLKGLYPKDAILGEESGLSSHKADAIWLIDPIDGTANFVRAIPYYCVSIGYVEKNEAKLAVIYDPEHDELFYAEKGKGAFLNRQNIFTTQPIWPTALIGLGRSERHEAEHYPQAIARLLSSGAEYRRQGAGALSLAHVAAGRVDAYVEAHMNPWDAVAGLLLAKEAGAVVGQYMVGDWKKGGLAYACAQSIHYELRDEIANLLNEFNPERLYE